VIRPNARLAPASPAATAVPDVSFAATSPVDPNLPPAGPRLLDLTPADDAVAYRLLASVFPGGVEL
jgi:hypothetical protein